MQAPNKKAAPFSFLFFVLFVIFKPNFPVDSPIFPRCYGGLAENVETGDEIKLFLAMNNRWTTAWTVCCVLKAFFSLVWHTDMSSVFRTGQSMNSMARKLVKSAKFVLVLTNTHMLKNQESSGKEFPQRYGSPQLSCHGIRKTLRQKE